MADSHWREGLLLRVVNVAAYVLFLGSTVYQTVISPQPIYENIKQTYLTPTVWAFLVWPIVHVLLFGTVVYQFTSPRGKAIVVDGISWEFPLLIILYAIFVPVWVNHHHNAAFSLSCSIVYVANHICRTLKKEHAPKSLGDELFVYLPFSVCEAWAAITLYMTGFEAFGIEATEQNDGIWTKVSVFFALFFLLYGAVDIALSPIAGDRPATFIISWTLWTISDHQRSSGFIHSSATASFILSILWDFVVMDGIYRQCTGRPHPSYFVNDERAPLLGC